MKEIQRTITGFDKEKIKINKSDAEGFSEIIYGIHKGIVESTKEPIGLREGISLVNGATKILFKMRKFADPFFQAAIIYNEIAKNHYFIEGNKRTAHCTAKTHLLGRGHHFKLKYKYAVKFIEEIADGKKSTEEIITWLKNDSTNYRFQSREKYLKLLWKEITKDEKRGRPKKNV